MTNDVLDQLEDSITPPTLGRGVSDELIAILRGDADVKTDWTSVRFGNAVEVLDGDRGSNYPSEGEFFERGYCLFLSAKNVLNGRFSFEQKNFVTKEKDSALRKGKLSRGDFVLTTRGTVGNYASFDQSIAYDNIRINSGMVILRPKANILDRSYFHYLLGSTTFRSSMETYSSGSAQPQLPIRDLSSIEIDLPPLHIQKQIADLLSVFDEKIELLRAQNKTLESIAQAIYKRWFVDFEFPMSEEDANELGKAELAGQPYKSSGGKMKTTELIDIPTDFQISTIGQIAELKSGFAFLSKDFNDQSSVKIIRIGDIQGRGVVGIKKAAAIDVNGLDAKKLAFYKLENGDMLIAMSGNTTGKLGFFVSNKSHYYFNQRVGKVFIKAAKFESFLRAKFSFEDIEKIIAAMAYGSAQPNFSPGQFASIPTVLPSEKLIDEFEKCTVSFYEKTIANSLVVEKVENTKSFLVDHLFASSNGNLNG